MSAPPFCDVCGTHHHKHQAHKFATAAVHVEPVVIDESKWVMRGASSLDVSNTVSNTVSNAQQSSVVTHTSAERVRKWRERNADLNRERQREYMRKRRANG